VEEWRSEGLVGGVDIFHFVTHNAFVVFVLAFHMETFDCFELSPVSFSFLGHNIFPLLLDILALDTYSLLASPEVLSSAISVLLHNSYRR
jgi:hypothetical protein